MKKLWALLPVFFLSPYFAFATNYPVMMNNGTVLINSGVGFGSKISEARQCPPLTISLDTAVPIAGLPFTLGLISGYFSEAGSSLNLKFLPLAGRIALHPNLGFRRFDAYILLTLGSNIMFRSGEPGEVYFWPGIGIGARYFFHPNIGGYAELGFDKVQNISFGFSFKI